MTNVSADTETNALPEDRNAERATGRLPRAEMENLVKALLEERKEFENALLESLKRERESTPQQKTAFVVGPPVFLKAFLKLDKKEQFARICGLIVALMAFAAAIIALNTEQSWNSGSGFVIGVFTLIQTSLTTLPFQERQKEDGSKSEWLPYEESNGVAPYPLR